MPNWSLPNWTTYCSLYMPCDFSTFAPLFLWYRGLKWPTSTPFSMSSAILQGLAQILSLWIFPHIPPPPFICKLLLPLGYFPKAPGVWHLLLSYCLSGLVLNLSSPPRHCIHHLLPEILQLHGKQSPCHWFFLQSIHYYQRQLSEIQTTSMI